MNAVIKRTLLTFRKSALIRRIFYAVLFLVAFVNNDPSRTIVLSRPYGIYIPMGSLIFLVGGGIITLVNLKKLFRMPKVLLIAGPVFAVYVLLQTGIRTVAGVTYDVGDMFYTVVELANISLSIIMAYCYVYSLKQKNIFALQPVCYLILAILCLYYVAIVAAEVVLPAIKSITGLSVAIDSLQRDVFKSLGYRRLYGPLGTPPSLGLVLIPICGYSLSLLRLKPKLRYLISFAVATVLIFLTGSRAPMLAYIILLAYCLLAWWQWQGVLLLAVSLLIMQATPWNISTLLPQRINPFKPESYLDARRVHAFLTCCKAWLSTSLSILFGVGYNQIILVTKKMFLSAAGLMKHEDIFTQYGFLPGGPHSIFNWSIASTGLMGFLLRCSFIYYFVFSVIRKFGSIFNKTYSVFIISVCISSLNLFTDEAHVAYPMLMACWFVFYIFALNLLFAPPKICDFKSVHNE